MAKGTSAITIKARNPGKKFSLLPLPCSASKCDNDFLLSYQGRTPKKRYCTEHAPPFRSSAPQQVRSEINEVLAKLNLI